MILPGLIVWYAIAMGIYSILMYCDSVARERPIRTLCFSLAWPIVFVYSGTQPEVWL